MNLPDPSRANDSEMKFLPAHTFSLDTAHRRQFSSSVLIASRKQVLTYGLFQENKF
jgi:hypothetical protein